MSKLGGNIDAPLLGKYSDPTHPALKPTERAEMYPIKEGLNMMVRRNHDDFPEYIKDESGAMKFTRQIDTNGQSALKAIQETDYKTKGSVVHITSQMKSKSNGKFDIKPF